MFEISEEDWLATKDKIEEMENKIIILEDKVEELETIHHPTVDYLDKPQERK